MKFCKECGTLYDEKQIDCPKCASKNIPVNEAQMDEAAAQKARKRSWLQILIGVPLFIGAIYLIIYLMQSIGS